MNAERAFEADWDDLRFFLAVSVRGSISAAARELKTSHSTVLRRIESLERSLGVRVLERLPEGYALTSAGEQLRNCLRGVQDQIERAQRRLAGLDAEMSGTIRVTTTDTLLHGVLAPMLAKFSALHPHIQLQLVVSNAFMSLTRREADIAIRPSSTPPQNLIGRKAGRIQTALYAQRDYWRGHANDSFHRHAWVVADDSLAHLAQARWVRANVPTDRIVATADSLVGMARLVRTGIGIGMLLTLLGDADPDLTRIADPVADLDTNVWILMHADLKHVARMSVFASFMFEQLGSHPAIARD